MKSIFGQAHIQPWLNPASLLSTGVVLFGAGSAGHILAEYFLRNGIKIHAVLDNFSTAESCAGVRVLRPQKIRSGLAIAADTPVIIATLNFSAYGKSGLEECRSFLLDCGWFHVASRPEWLQALFHASIDLLQDTYDRWFDDKSSNLYKQAITFLSTRAAESEPEEQENTYFAIDVPFHREKLRWVQGGAFTGDSIIQAMDLGIPIESGVFFEPEPGNFEKLVDTVYKSGIEASCWPCGLWSELKALRFHSGNGADSYLDQDGDSLVQCIDLDSAVHRFAPTLVTLDVEGAELAALQGMVKTIVSFRPTLAISIYHRPDDWWSIPSFLHDINAIHELDYRFYLRVHASHATDAILYAVPS